MPQSHIKSETVKVPRSVNLNYHLNNLAFLASGATQSTWKKRVEQPDMADASTRRAHRWCEIAQKFLEGYDSKHQHFPSPVKREICRWLLHKHSVLNAALRRGDILQIDVLDAVVCDFLLM